MAFGDISTNTQAFGQPNTSDGLLGMLALMQQMQRNKREQDRYDAETQQSERLRSAMAGFDPQNPEGGLLAMYQASPETASKVHTDIEQRKLIAAQTKKAQSEQAGALEKKGIEWATNFAKSWLSLPPNQRDPARANAFIDSEINSLKDSDPEFASVLFRARQNPEWFNHTAAKAGVTDPYLDDQRQLGTFQAQEDYKNSLPPSPAEQQRLGLDQQRLGLDQQRLSVDQQNAQFERGRKYWDAVSSAQQAFEGLKPVQTYKVAASELVALTNLADQDNKAADLGFILGGAKIGDPIGSVREGDQILWSGTGSWFEKLRGMWSMVQEGGRLTPKMRADILKEARTKVEALRGGYENEVKNAETTAKERGFEPGHLKTGSQSIAPSKLEKVWEALRANPEKAGQIREYAKANGIPDSMLW